VLGGKAREGAREARHGKAPRGKVRCQKARKAKVLGGKAREGARRQGKVCRHEETS
jgi:hypothetical protein